MDRYVWSEDGMIVDTTKPWHDPDQDPDTATDEPLYEEIDDTVDLLNDQDFEIIALRARVAALEAELDELKSFDGIMRQIDEHYPLDIPYFHDSNDPGCVAMRAQRQCLLATQRAETAEARVAELEKVAEAAKDYDCDACRVCVDDDLHDALAALEGIDSE